MARWGCALLAAAVCTWWQAAAAAASCLGAPWTDWVAAMNASSQLAKANFDRPPIVLDEDTWPSQNLVTEVARVLLQEGLGQRVLVTPCCGSPTVDSTNWTPEWMSRLANGSLSANLEVWTTGTHKQAAMAGSVPHNHNHNPGICPPDSFGQPTFTSSDNGPCVMEVGHTYSGTSAQTYVAQATSNSLVDTDYWPIFTEFTDNTSAQMLALPPANFTVNETRFPRHICSNLTAPAGETNKCAPDGRFYPTVCGGITGNLETAAAAGCKAFFAASSGWDYGLAEAAIEARGLLLVITYIGVEAPPLGYTTILQAYLQAAFEAGQ